jgi:hypothetical protein
MMEAARTSETSVDIYFTRQYLWWWRQHVPLKRLSTIILHCSTPDDGGSTYLWNVGRQLFYTAVPLMMEAARTSETLVDSYFTRQYPWLWRQHVPLKRWSTVILHGSTPDYGGSTYLWNVCRQLFYTAVSLMMEAARTSETSVDNYFTRQYPWWWRQHVPLKRLSTIILHGSTSDDGGSTYLWNVCRHLFYKAVHPRRHIVTRK